MIFLANISDDGMAYTFNNNKKTVSIAFYDFARPDKKVTIPQCINWSGRQLPITCICSESFKDSNNLETIEFAPNSRVFKIDDSAFFSSAITTLSLPKSVIELEKGWCTNIANLIHITISPDNPRYKVYDDKYIIGKSTAEKSTHDTLYFAVRNIEIATIPSFIEIVESTSFNCCKKLQKVEFLEDSKLKAIENDAFPDSTVKTISFPPSSFELIKSWCYGACELIEIVVHEKNRRYKFYENQYLLEKTNLESDDFDILVFASRNIKIAKIPDFVVVIKQFAFENCHQLKRVEASENSKLQVIDKDAFLLSKIESISIPPSLIELRKDWSYHTNFLQSIEIDPRNKKFMSYDNQFILSKSSPEKKNFDVLNFAVRNIKKATIPDFIETIESCAFEKCKQLETVLFSKNSMIQVIGDYSFSRSRIKEFNLPPHVTKICDGAFYKCKFLTKFVIPSDSKLEIIEKDAFYNSGIEDFVCPSSITRIFDGAFNNCPNLFHFTFPPESKLSILDCDLFMKSNIKSFVLPPYVKKICSSCFEDCSEMSKFEVPENSELEVIDDQAFIHSDICSFTIPKKVSQIGINIFMYCRNLRIVEICDGSELACVNVEMFGFINALIMISVEKKNIINRANVETMTYI